ncbi:MAG: MarC family protein [Neomegalonema sp.]|nr:MarC family protein [Neomegalonema sp.]
MSLEAAITAFVTLFVVIDPIGLAPIFAALTRGASRAERARIARSGVLIGFAILIAFGLFGQSLLSAIGIGLPAFRISGGIMLFLIAMEMLFERRTERRRRAGSTEPAGSAQQPDGGQEGGPEGGQDGRLEADPTVFPLATPLIAGPGAMATMVLLSSNAADWAERGVVFACLVLVLSCNYLLFRAAGGLERLIGQTGIAVLTRLLGVLLGALAVQFVLDGLADFGFVARG